MSGSLSLSVGGVTVVPGGQFTGRYKLLQQHNTLVIVSRLFCVCCKWSFGISCIGVTWREKKKRTRFSAVFCKSNSLIWLLSCRHLSYIDKSMLGWNSSWAQHDEFYCFPSCCLQKNIPDGKWRRALLPRHRELKNSRRGREWPFGETWAGQPRNDGVTRNACKLSTLYIRGPEVYFRHK